jgi:hypothetical protein
MWQFIDAMWTDKLDKLKHAAEHAERSRAAAQPKRGTK